MYEIINFIISIIVRMFLIIFGTIIVIAMMDLLAYPINSILPTRIILIGLRKEEQREVLRAWNDMSTRYKVIKKIQSGIYSHLPDKKRPLDYGRTEPAHTLINIFRSNTYLYVNPSTSSQWHTSHLYYDYTIHELTHTLAKVLVPSFKEGHFRVTLKYDDDTYNACVEDFIESTKEKYNISSDDIKIYVSNYASTKAGETLAECMRLYFRYEANDELKKEYYDSYQIVNAFITEFDKIYESKTS